MSPISVSILYSFSFIPSIMHRLESLLVAFNLKKMCMQDHIPSFKVSCYSGALKISYLYIILTVLHFKDGPRIKNFMTFHQVSLTRKMMKKRNSYYYTCFTIVSTLGQYTLEINWITMASLGLISYICLLLFYMFKDALCLIRGLIHIRG